MKKTLIFLSVAGVMGLAACTSAPKGEAMTEQADQALLSAYSWRLDRVFVPAEASQAEQVRPFDLSFTDNHLSVSGLCNSLGGAYQLDGAHIEVQPMMSTKMMCADEALMQLENYVGQVLPTAERWGVEGVDAAAPSQARPVLTLNFADGARWQFDGTPTPETIYGQEGTTAFLEVDATLQNCVGGSGQCFNVRPIEYNDQGIQTEVGNWFLLDKDQLQGVSVEPGYQTIIRTKRFTEKNAQGGERPVYFYDMTVESKQI